MRSLAASSPPSHWAAARKPAERIHHGGGYRPACNQAGASGSGRRTICSNSLVNSRAMTISRCGFEQGRQVGDSFLDAVGRFVEHQRCGYGLQGFDRRPAGADFCRQEADEMEGPIVAIVQTCGRKRGNRRVGAGQRGNGETCGAHGSHGPRTRIGNPRRAGVRDHRHALAFCQQRDQLFCRRLLVVFMYSQQLCADVVVFQQAPRMARVLAGDYIRRAQHFQRTQSNVAEVADGGSDDE